MAAPVWRDRQMRWRDYRAKKAAQTSGGARLIPKTQNNVPIHCL
jgi:hypothetical protein